MAQARGGLRRRGHAAGGGELLGERLAHEASAASNAARAGLAVDGEDDALEARAAVEVPADLLDLDPRRLLEREAADAGAERDEREAAGPELVRELRGWRRWRGG